MGTEDVGCLVVVDGGQVKGIITDRDVAIRCCGEGDEPDQCSVGDHMTPNAFTIEPDADIFEAMTLMIDNEIKRLPVTDGGRLVGLLSYSDVAEAMARPVSDLMLGMGKTRQTAGVTAGAAGG